MRDFTEFDSETTDKNTFQNEMPVFDDVQILQIAQQLEPQNQANLIEPISDTPDAIQSGEVTNNDEILNKEYFFDPQSSDNSGETITSFVTPLEDSNTFQLLPSYNEQNTSEANTMLDYPLEDTTYQQGSAIEDLPPIDVVDVEPPKYITDLEDFPTVINDVDPKTDVVTLVVTSGQTGEQVKVQTTAEQLPNVVAAAVVADKAIETEATQTAATTQTTTTPEIAAEDLLWGYDRSTVYAVGGIAAIALLIGLSYFGEE